MDGNVTSRRVAVAALMGGAVILLKGCRPSIEDRVEFNYRLTVEVETPQGTSTGSSVIWVRAVRTPDWVNPEGRGNRAKFKGEAVAVDLPNGKTLFVLLQTESGASDAADYPILAFNNELQGSADMVDGYQWLSTSQGQSAQMPRTELVLPNGGTEVSAWPLLVMFEDIADPTSIKRVDPDNLTASFGVGYRLKSISVTIADEPITNRIINRLGWLFDKNRKKFDPDRKPEGIPLGDFTRLFSTEKST